MSPAIEPVRAASPSPSILVPLTEPAPTEDPFEEALITSDDDSEENAQEYDLHTERIDGQVSKQVEEEKEEELSTIAPLSLSVPRSPSVRSLTGPLNPFRKPGDLTPNKRQSFDVTSIRFGTSGRDRAWEAEMPKAPPRQSLDVDAFKRLILTGKIDPAEDSIPVKPVLLEPSHQESVSLCETPVMDANIGNLKETGIYKPRTEALVASDELLKPLQDLLPGRVDCQTQSALAANIGSAVSSSVATAATSETKLVPHPRSSSSESLYSSFNPSSAQHTLSPAIPTPSTACSQPPITSILLPVDLLEKYQPPLPSPLVEEKSPTSANVMSQTTPRKPLPPSPPLSRKDSTRRTALSIPAISGSLSRSNSGRKAPPPPARRALSNPQSTAVANTPLTIATPKTPLPTPEISRPSPPPSLSDTDSSLNSTKTLSPPPPPPRGTRRKGKPLVSNLNDQMPLHPISIPSPIGALSEQSEIQSAPNLRPISTPEPKENEDILANLESLQKEVEKLRGIVQSRNGGGNVVI